MKYLITGGSGQLGYDVYRELEKRYDITNIGISMPSHEDFDITDKERVDSFIKIYRPDVIFHCAAYTDVNKAESDSEQCYKVNVDGTKNLISSAASIGAKVIYVSTDYVFDGNKDGVYTILDTPNPLNVYGKTKYYGEQVASLYDKSFIVRTSWVFGINGNNFVKTMLRLAETRDEVSVVADQFGSPTYTPDLAKLLVDMSETDKYGLYHANNEGYTNWAEFAEYIFKVAGKDVKVNPIRTSDYKTPATRPLNTCLDKSCLTNNGFEKMEDWHYAIDKYIPELKRQEELKKTLEKRD